MSKMQWEEKQENEMSDDLISRKAAINILLQNLIKNGDMYLAADATKWIESLPTAFDKEKVMNEIKEYKEDSEEWAKKSIENTDEFSTYADAYKRCLAIVEKGGLDE